MELNSNHESILGFEKAVQFLGRDPDFHDAHYASINVAVYQQEISIHFLGFTFRDESTGASREEQFECSLKWSQIVEASLGFDGEGVLEFTFEDVPSQNMIRTVIWTSGGACSTIDSKSVTMSDWVVREWQTNNARLSMTGRLGPWRMLTYDGPEPEPWTSPGIVS